MTEFEFKELAHRVCWKYKKSTDPKHSDTYTFNEKTLAEFYRLIKLMDKNNGSSGSN